MQRMDSKVFWQRDISLAKLKTFQGDLQEVDVAVAGGGLVGLLTALLLKKAGHRVALFEARVIGDGVTARSTAKVTALHGTRCSEIEKMHGLDAARLYAQLNHQAVDELENLVRAYHVDCGWTRQDAYTFAETSQEDSRVRREADILAEAGLPAKYVSDTPLPLPVQGAVQLSNSAQFEPVRFLNAILNAIPGDGSHVFGGSRVTEVKSGQAAELSINGHRLKANWVVLATHIPILDRGLYFARVFPYRAYMLAARYEGRLEGMHVNAGNPTHSVRQAGDYLVFAGYGHKVAEQDDPWRCYDALANWASQTFGVTDFEYRWSTQDLFSADLLPLMGLALPGVSNLLTATGFGGWGLSNSMVAARLIVDQIQGEAETAKHRLFSPQRFQLAGAKELLKENLKAAKHFVKDRLESRPDDDEQPAPGQGCVVGEGLSKVAMYRDPGGRLRSFSATCPHLGCVVQWNPAEKSFDCPCHGSRFGVNGEVLNGPAVESLKPIESD